MTLGDCDTTNNTDSEQLEEEALLLSRCRTSGPRPAVMSTRRAQSVVSLNVEDETQTKVETKAKGKRKKVKGPRYMIAS